MDNSRLVLGTAQLGMKYGIANTNGQPSGPTAEAIIREAWDGGIREFDTASSYGESERVLGACLRSLRIAGKAKIITKISPHVDHLSKGALSSALGHSLQALGVESLYGLLLHSERLLDVWNIGLYDVLHEMVDRGLVERLGVSVYSTERAFQALAATGIDIIQVPSNLLDRRFELAGIFEAAEAKKKQIYVRSVYLQGLLVMTTEKCPAPMHFAVPILDKLKIISEQLGLSQQVLALGFVKVAYPKAKVLFGAETQQQVKENIVHWQENLPPELIEYLRREFSNVPETIVNPSLWPH